MQTVIIARDPMRKHEHEPRTHSPSDLAAEMTGELRRMGDSTRARGAERYFKHEIVAIGITTPVLRQFVKQRVRSARSGWTLRDAIQLCNLLLKEQEMEIRGAAILALAEFRRQYDLELLPHADRWLERRLDNWALVDGFCGSVLRFLLERHHETVEALRRWSGAKSLWKRRASLVALIASVHRGRRLDLAYTLATDHLGDPEDLMHKATGWLLREAGATDAARLERYLLEHGPKIPRTALRYAIEKFTPSERARLLAATRAPLPRP
jgi:3-methyladenine DNA glycosylase AlkD